MLHRRQPRVAIICGGRAVERDVLRVHRHPQHRHVVLPADHRANPAIRTVNHRERRAVAEPPDHPFKRSRHKLAVLAEQTSVRAEEQRRAVESAEFALDYSDHNVAAVCRGGLAQPLGLWAGHLDPGIEIEPKFFAANWVSSAHHKTVVESLWISPDECFGEDNHACAGGGGFTDQANGLVDAGFAIEGRRSSLNYSDTHGSFFFGRGHWFSLGVFAVLRDFTRNSSRLENQFRAKTQSSAKTLSSDDTLRADETR